ncbi:MAG: histidine phosphatase family protein [Myxococcaceae bacterium]
MFYLVRHGETAWNVLGQQASFTDLCLTPHGEAQARTLKPRLSEINFSEVWCSPLRRARKTCELAGFIEHAEIIEDLTEWHAGDYEGMKSADIEQLQPGWSMMTHGAPGGESVEKIKLRVSRVLERMQKTSGDILIFSSSHFLRALTACFLGQEPAFGRHLPLATAALSILDKDNNMPVIRLWNASGQGNGARKIRMHRL